MSQLKSDTFALFHRDIKETVLMAMDVLTVSVNAVHHMKAAFNILPRGRLFEVTHYSIEQS